MRKIKNSGFMLVETLIVSVFVGVTLIFLFVGLQEVETSYNRTFTYNTTNALYSAGKIKNYLFSVNFETLEADLLASDKGYLDVTSCEKTYYMPVTGEEAAFQEYCNLLYESLNVKQILFSLGDLESIKYKMEQNRSEDQISQKMLDFANYVPYEKSEDDNGYRYIRNTINGNSVNAGNHWVEMIVRDKTGNIISTGKTVTSSMAPTNNTSLSSLVDGVTTTTPYIGISTLPQWVEIDLGEERQIGSVTVYHYYEDGRYYKENRTVLYNGDRTLENVLYDSDIDGTYAETSSGYTLNVSHETTGIYRILVEYKDGTFASVQMKK